MLTLYAFIEINLNCDTEFPPQNQELVGISSKASAFLFSHPKGVAQFIRCESSFVFPKVWLSESWGFGVFFFFAFLPFLPPPPFVPWDTSSLSSGYRGKLKRYPFYKAAAMSTKERCSEPDLLKSVEAFLPSNRRQESEQEPCQPSKTQWKFQGYSGTCNY